MPKRSKPKAFLLTVVLLLGVESYGGGQVAFVFCGRLVENVHRLCCLIYKRCPADLDASVSCKFSDFTTLPGMLQSWPWQKQQHTNMAFDVLACCERKTSCLEPCKYLSMEETCFGTASAGGDVGASQLPCQGGRQCQRRSPSHPSRLNLRQGHNWTRSCIPQGHCILYGVI